MYSLLEPVGQVNVKGLAVSRPPGDNTSSMLGPIGLLNRLTQLYELNTSAVAACVFPANFFTCEAMQNRVLPEVQMSGGII